MGAGAVTGFAFLHFIFPAYLQHAVLEKWLGHLAYLGTLLVDCDSNAELAQGETVVPMLKRWATFLDAVH